jgi:CheY-like chemotaxis protein
MEHIAHTHRSVSVLVVEDEALISEWVSEVLADEGFEVHAVATAEEAVAYLNQAGDVDVLFTDINLPGPMDGARLAQVARARKPQLSVIYASGRLPALDPHVRVPGSTFVPKPYMPSQIVALISRLTGVAGPYMCAGSA